MRSYKELEQEYIETAKRHRLPKPTQAFGKPLFIAGAFLTDNEIEPTPRAEARERAAEALERYEPEERAAFTLSLQAYFETLDNLADRLTGGR